MSDRSIRATGLAALALSLVLALYSLSLAGKARRAIDAAGAVVAKNEAWAAGVRSNLDRLHREIVETRAMLDRMLEAEREQARRARGETWRGRID
jgi:hypothetical protein